MELTLSFTDSTRSVFHLIFHGLRKVCCCAGTLERNSPCLSQTSQGLCLSPHLSWTPQGLSFTPSSMDFTRSAVVLVQWNGTHLVFHRLHKVCCCAGTMEWHSPCLSQTSQSLLLRWYNGTALTLSFTDFTRSAVALVQWNGTHLVFHRLHEPCCCASAVDQTHTQHTVRLSHLKHTASPDTSCMSATFVLLALPATSISFGHVPEQYSFGTVSVLMLALLISSYRNNKDVSYIHQKKNAAIIGHLKVHYELII